MRRPAVPARGVVLAAGRSRRMGALKPLLPLDGIPAVLRAARAFSEIGVRPLVVLGFAADEIEPALDEAGIDSIVNKEFERGMASSVRAGLAAVRMESEPAWLGVLPADCCLVRPETVGRLARAQVMEDASVVYPAVSGRRGHPPLLGPEPQAAVLTAPQATLREALAGFERHAVASGRGRSVVTVEVDDPGVLLDMDDPAGYERMAEAARRERLPDATGCEALLVRRGVPGPVREHGARVAAVARCLGEAVQPAGAFLDAALLDAAARLHDVARGEHDHAAAGARWLGEAGYRRVAAVVAPHMAGPAHASLIPDEASLLFLADKLVDSRRVVSLEERLASTLARHEGDGTAQAAARQRLQAAGEVAAAVERLAGRPLPALLATLAS